MARASDQCSSNYVEYTKYISGDGISARHQHLSASAVDAKPRRGPALVTVTGLLHLPCYLSTTPASASVPKTRRFAFPCSLPNGIVSVLSTRWRSCLTEPNTEIPSARVRSRSVRRSPAGERRTNKRRMAATHRFNVGKTRPSRRAEVRLVSKGGIACVMHGETRTATQVATTTVMVPPLARLARDGRTRTLHWKGKELIRLDALIVSTAWSSCCRACTQYRRIRVGGADSYSGVSREVCPNILGPLRVGE